MHGGAGVGAGRGGAAGAEEARRVGAAADGARRRGGGGRARQRDVAHAGELRLEAGDVLVRRRDVAADLLALHGERRCRRAVASSREAEPRRERRSGASAARTVSGRANTPWLGAHSK